MSDSPALGRARMIRAAAVFVVCIVGLYWLTSLLDERVLEPTAAALGALLSLIGQEARVDGALIHGRGHSFAIVGECTAVFPAVLLVSAVIAFPSRVRSKLLGVLGGLCAVLLVNQLRLVTLWFVHAHLRDSFDLVHVYVWQPLMIVVVLVLFVVWLEWSGAKPQATAPEPA